MPNITFVDGQKPVITAAWLNDVGFVLYDLLGNGTDLPATRSELLSNIGGSGGGGGGGGGTMGATTFQQETAPPSPAVGDLWQVPSTGIMSRWNGTTWVIFGDIAGPAAAAAEATATAAATQAATAATAAAAATSAIAAIASDNVLSSGEKSAILLDYTTLTNEQTGIDNQATAFAITTEKTTYDNAVAALTSYLATLTTPTLWSDTTGDTTIVGSTFRTNFGTVYAARQALLNKIAAVSKAVADSAVTDAATAQAAAVAAQAAATAANTAAATAQAGATAALNQLTSIASDNVLSQVEKPAVILDWANISGESTGIDAQAGAYGITTERTNFDNAYNALNTYLGTLTSPVAWNNLSGDTTIVGSTFRTNFAAYYSTRQILLNEIARVAGTVATWAGVSGVSVTTGQIALSAATETYYDFHDYAGGTPGTGTLRTVTVTPSASGFLEFNGSVPISPNDGDGGARVSWLVTPSDGSGAFYTAGSIVPATGGFSTTTSIDAWAATGGVSYQIDFIVTKGGYSSIALKKYIMRIAVVKR